MPEYDPERALWIPGRRSFLFMLGAALVVPTVPPITPVYNLRDILWRDGGYSLLWDLYGRSYEQYQKGHPATFGNIVA